MIVSEGNTTSYEQAPSGTYNAVCYRVIDLGTQEEEYQGVKSVKRKLMLSFEIEERMKNGQRFTISKFYTASLNPKSKLRPDLESWRGKPFSEAELKGFDLSKLVGQGCLLSIIENDSGKAKVSAIARLPKSMPAIEADEFSFNFSLDNFDQKAFELLPEGIQKIIQKSPEYAAAVNPPKVEPQKKALPNKASAAIEEDLDDEIPF